MKVTFEYLEKVPVEVWDKHDKEDTLVDFVEECAWRAIEEAVDRGYKQPIANINIEAFPGVDDPPKEHIVKTMLEYVSSV